MHYEWAVIGAGPAGIAAVGKLLDANIAKEKIVWIDEHFQVGDFGRHWRNIPSNTTVKLFIQFLQSCQAFQIVDLKNQALFAADPHQTCQLALMADALQALTDGLKKVVATKLGTVKELSMQKRHWMISIETLAPVIAQNVILATGAESKQLNHGLPIIPLKIALDASKITEQLEIADNIAVFGSSHSAMLVLKNLVDQKVKRIINFYKSPLRYAIYLKNWILFDDTGLKGSTASWARENIDTQLPNNLERYYASEENIQHYLPQCNKVVYAVGFERRLLPAIKELGHVSYIKQCGIIAPGLFGLGIAFPEAKLNPLGMNELRVGLWKFMEYLQTVLPIWLAYKA